MRERVIPQNFFEKKINSPYYAIDCALHSYCRIIKVNLIQ